MMVFRMVIDSLVVFSISSIRGVVIAAIVITVHVRGCGFVFRCVLFLVMCRVRMVIIAAQVACEFVMIMVMVLSVMRMIITILLRFPLYLIKVLLIFLT